MGLFDLFSKKKKYEGTWVCINEGKASVIEIKEKDKQYLLNVYEYFYDKGKEKITGMEKGHQVCELKYTWQKKEYANMIGNIDDKTGYLLIMGLPLSYSYVDNDINHIKCFVDNRIYSLLENLSDIKLSLQKFELQKVLASGFYAIDIDNCGEYVRKAVFKF